MAWGNIITGRFDDLTVSLILSKKPKLSRAILFLSIDIDPIFLRYHPNIGIFNNSFFKTKTGESNIVRKKKFQTMIGVSLQ